MQDVSPKPDSSQSPAANWAETAPTSCWQHLHHVPTSSLLHKIKHAEKIEIPLKLKKKKTSPAADRCWQFSGGFVPRAAREGQQRGQEEGLWQGGGCAGRPPLPRPTSPPCLPKAALPFLAFWASKIHPAFKETSQFVPFPFGACQFVTDCRNP